METQKKDIIRYGSFNYKIASEPLNDYLIKLENPPKFTSNIEHCIRGYVGCWDIIKDKLYLVKLTGYVKNEINDEYSEIDIDFIFPNKFKVFADWFSGEIRIPLNDNLRYYHFNNPLRFEEDLFLEFQSGRFIKRRKEEYRDQKIKNDFHEYEKPSFLCKFYSNFPDVRTNFSNYEISFGEKIMKFLHKRYKP